jgi:hypothetical protein
LVLAAQSAEKVVTADSSRCAGGRCLWGCRRIGDQLNYFHPKVRTLARTRRTFQFAVLAAGAAGALLAAVGFEVWIGLTTAIAAGAIAYLGDRQVESTLVAYNQSAGKLEALKRDWEARPPARRDHAAFELEVADAEAVLATELGGWVQQMRRSRSSRRSSWWRSGQAVIDQTLSSSGGSGQPSSEPPKKSDKQPESESAGTS